MTDSIKRIAVLGPESTGKSVLCDELAFHYSTLRVSEYARKYLSGLVRSYNIEDVVEIYKTQLHQEQQFLKSANKYLFTDTEFIIAKVWCEHVFKSCPMVLEDLLVKNPYDLYLLTAPDLPWEFDPLRENPGKGNFFFEWYRNILEQNQFNYGVVSGLGRQRTLSAIAIIDNRFREI